MALCGSMACVTGLSGLFLTVGEVDTRMLFPFIVLVVRGPQTPKSIGLSNTKFVPIVFFLPEDGVTAGTVGSVDCVGVCFIRVFFFFALPFGLCFFVVVGLVVKIVGRRLCLPDRFGAVVSVVGYLFDGSSNL